jgi:hypothetical protein
MAVLTCVSTADSPLFYQRQQLDDIPHFGDWPSDRGPDAIAGRSPNSVIYSPDPVFKQLFIHHSSKQVFRQ